MVGDPADQSTLERAIAAEQTRFVSRTASEITPFAMLATRRIDGIARIVTITTGDYESYLTDIGSFLSSTDQCTVKR